MDTPTFIEILKTQYSYHSPRPKNFSDKMLPQWVATGIYYTLLLNLIYDSSKVARTGYYDSNKWIDDSARILRFVEKVGGRHEISGLREMAQHTTPVVFIANHMSMLDTFLLPSLIQTFHRVTFVIKESLLHYPVFGSIMRAIRPIAIERKNPRTDLKIVLEEGRRLLQLGCSLVIFPQSTRSTQFNPSEFNSLGVKLAKQAGVPIVPIALKTDFQSNGQLIREMGMVDPKKTVHISFGRPLSVLDNGQETHQKVIRFITENLRQWGAEVRP
jgi:1-acyl-sn-glycerol-3-phosphate acyltransferase